MDHVNDTQVTKPARIIGARRTELLSSHSISGIAGFHDNSMKASDPRNAFYWRFVELGTINMPAHPFIRPAFDTTEELAARIAIQRMNQAIDEVLSK